MARIFELDPNRMRDLPDETGGDEEEDGSSTFETVETAEDEDLDLDEDDEDETLDTVDWVSNDNRSRGRWDLEMSPREDFDRRFILPSDEEFDEAS